MRSLLFVTLLAASACASAAPITEPAAMAQTPVFPDDARLLEIIKSRVEDGRATGLVLGVMEPDGSTRVVAYGDPGADAKPLGPDSVFEIGSVTKVFTTTLLAGMVSKGEVTLDAAAQTYAPQGMTLPARNGKAITLANLAEQNSGLPRLPGNLDLGAVDMSNPYAAYTTQMLHAFLAGYTLPRDPGAEFEYSNLGMGVLGGILANRAGQDYETLVKARILTPLGMTTTGITLTPEMQAQLARGHDASGAPAANWDLPSLSGAGALRSSMRDMLKFLDANVGEPTTDLERAMRLAQTPRFDMSPNARIGLGWITVNSKSGDSFLYHDGGTGGYGAIIAVDPKRKVGLVLLGNRTGVPEDIAMHLLDPTIPLAPPPAPAAERKEIVVPTDVLATYTGVYALDAAPAFQLTVALESGQLHMQATGQGKYPVFAESQSKFFLKVVDAQITFVPAKDGAPAHLILHQGGVDQKATKMCESMC
jgi:D-alanyl-D-alanine-carboxypeptidase/D-alanyl-D-alanine-endopeptidase